MDFQIQQKGLILNLMLGESLPMALLSDAKRLKQVFFNLMGNALKFTFRGSISVALEFANNNLIAKVEDTGIGMSATDLNKLFRFFGCLDSSKEFNRGGMGLGLTISQQIIKKLGGDI